MQMPKLEDSSSWGKGKVQNKSSMDIGLTAAGPTIANTFSSDRSLMREFMHQKKDSSNVNDSSKSKLEGILQSKPDPPVSKNASEDATTIKPALTSNKLAAKVLQLRMKGLHDEAYKLLNKEEAAKMKQNADDVSSRQPIDRSTRYVMHALSAWQKKKSEDADVHLAQKIVQNKQYSAYCQADEYDYDDEPRRKIQKKAGVENHKLAAISNHARHILTQQERCQFCFENPTRPKHLVVTIANFTYLSLPMWQPIVPGHCCILTIQHESATRSLDDNVWEEIRNFKKCLVMMFAKQEKDLVFLETVMGLAQQRRHCLVECIPLTRQVAKQAPLFFKKVCEPILYVSHYFIFEQLSITRGVALMVSNLHFQPRGYEFESPQEQSEEFLEGMMPRVYWKQPLYLMVGVRSAYTLPSPDPTSGIIDITFWSGVSRKLSV